MSFLDVFALFILAMLLITVIAVIGVFGSLPGRIARNRRSASPGGRETADNGVGQAQANGTAVQPINIQAAPFAVRVKLDDPSIAKRLPRDIYR